MCGGGSKYVLVFLKCRSAFKNEYTTSVLKKSRAGYDLRHTPSAHLSSDKSTMAEGILRFGFDL